MSRRVLAFAHSHASTGTSVSRRTVLIVLRGRMERARLLADLTEIGYAAVGAGGAAGALKQMATLKDLDLLVIEVSSAGIGDAVQLAALARRLHPTLAVVGMSGLRRALQRRNADGRRRDWLRSLLDVVLDQR